MDSIIYYTRPLDHESGLGLSLQHKQPQFRLHSNLLETSDGLIDISSTNGTAWPVICSCISPRRKYTYHWPSGPRKTQPLFLAKKHMFQRYVAIGAQEVPAIVLDEKHTFQRYVFSWHAQTARDTDVGTMAPVS